MHSNDNLEMSTLYSTHDDREPDEESGLTGAKPENGGVAGPAGPRRRSVGVSHAGITEHEARIEERRLANKEFWKVAIVNGMLIVSW
jgi:hypothetical protein